MPKDYRRRVLTVGGQRYLWKTYHQHVDGCVEVLRLRQIGSVAGLTLVFRSDGERRIPGGWMFAAGVIAIGDRWLNLNKPSVVRAFVDAAVEASWMAETRTVGLRDGWDRFDDAYARNAHG
ncbi:hypothetical protein AB0C34_10815 [Nocardia sp. NPDC049220]|uniref:hypothetical protein n=1 Tax=Nocardia sp. NPDC049220 TaxID=3155273 RepID=UPI0033F99374